MSFRITGLPLAPFAPLFALSTAELAARDIVRMTATGDAGYPCRITLADAARGESVLLLNYEHQPAATPYRSSHAIFVRESATATYDELDRVPHALRQRLLSVRAFDEAGMMTDADVVDGRVLEPLIERLFADQRVKYLHAHNARPGCFAAAIHRS
jgi:hypothetical protein